MKQMKQQQAETETRNAYAEKIKDMIDKWNTDLAVLEEKARARGTEVQKEFEVKAEAFRRKRAELESELKEAETSGEAAWDKLKSGAEEAWADLRRAFDEAKDKLN